MVLKAQQAIAADPAAPSSPWAAVRLCKPGILVSNVLAASAGYAAAVATGAQHDGLRLAAGLGGTALLVASASAWNMILERHADARMTRTCARPLPSGAMSVGRACGIATSTMGAGALVLGVFAGATALLLGVVALALYVLVYTPMKARSAWSLPVGAIAGALPPLIGGAAAGELVGAPLWLAAWIFVWQHPHFVALGLARREEYAAAGLRVLPVIASLRVTGAALVVSAAALMPLGLGLASSLHVGLGGLLVVSAGASWLFARCVMAAARPQRGPAMGAFFASLVALLAALAVALGAAWL